MGQAANARRSGRFIDAFEDKVDESLVGKTAVVKDVMIGNNSVGESVSMYFIMQLPDGTILELREDSEIYDPETDSHDDDWTCERVASALSIDENEVREIMKANDL